MKGAGEGGTHVTLKIEFRKVCVSPNIKGFERKSLKKKN
jgi:hypothetical protein